MSSKKRKKKPVDREKHREKYQQRAEASRKVAAKRTRMALPVPHDDDRPTKKGRLEISRPTAEELAKSLVVLVHELVDATADLADVETRKDRERGGNLVSRIQSAVRSQRRAATDLLRDLLGREPVEEEVDFAVTSTEYISYGDLDEASDDDDDEDCEC